MKFSIQNVLSTISIITEVFKLIRELRKENNNTNNISKNKIINKHRTISFKINNKMVIVSSSKFYSNYRT